MEASSVSTDALPKAVVNNGRFEIPWKKWIRPGFGSVLKFMVCEGMAKIPSIQVSAIYVHKSIHLDLPEFHYYGSGQLYDFLLINVSDRLVVHSVTLDLYVNPKYCLTIICCMFSYGNILFL